jgi:hypothetical protein
MDTAKSTDSLERCRPTGGDPEDEEETPFVRHVDEILL